MNYHSLKIVLFFSACMFFIFTSCESHEKKVDDAFDRVKKSKYELKVLVKPNPGAISTSTNKSYVIKPESTDEWTVFKLVIEEKIFDTETKINQMKISKKGEISDARNLKKIFELEKRNNNLRKQINDYNEEVKLNFSKFKVGLLHDLDEIKLEMKDVSIHP